MKQHPFAVVEPGAEIADDVEIGPCCIVHSGAVIGPGCVLRSHVVIHGCARIGAANTFHQGCSIGDDPQDNSQEKPTYVEIGDGNTFREHVTVHRGTFKDRRLTTIGDDNLFMAYSHVAHDCIVGNHTTFYNSGNLAGHVIVEDYAGIGALGGVHQFCRIGAYSFMGAGTIATKDVVPYALVNGQRAVICGVNLVGLRRKGFPRPTIDKIKEAYRLLFYSPLNTTQALERIEAEIAECPEVDRLVAFVREAKRGIAKRDRHGERDED